MKRKFILNPASRRSPKDRALAELRTRLRARLGEFDVTVTSNWDDLQTQTREALRSGYEQIIALGGDGTVHAVVNAFFEKGKLVNPKASLVVSQCGTGSDYFRSICGGKTVNWEDLPTEHTVRKVDIGHIKFTTPFVSETLFANLASLGLSAEVVRRKDESKVRFPGFLSYFAPTLASLIHFKPSRMKVTIDGEVFEDEVLALLIAKGAYMGAGMRISKTISLESGKLDVLLIKKMNWGEVVSRVPKLYTGNWAGDDRVARRAAKVISVETESPMPVEFDGELKGQTNIEIKVKPACLPLCFPK